MASTLLLEKAVDVEAEEEPALDQQRHRVDGDLGAPVRRMEEETAVDLGPELRRERLPQRWIGGKSVEERVDRIAQLPLRRGGEVVAPDPRVLRDGDAAAVDR